MIRPRADWIDPAMPVTGPAATPGSIVRIVVHYTGSATVSADTVSVLRAIQRDYVDNRGYSIGYNFAVDAYGQAWELRGLDIRCAANKGVNESTYAILCLVDGAQPASAAMLNGVRECVAVIRRHLGRPVPIQGHRDVGATPCPGDGLYAQIKAGAFEPVDLVAPQPTPVPQEDDTVKYICMACADNDQRPELMIAFDGSGIKKFGFSTVPDRDKLIAAYGATRVALSEAQYNEILARSY